MFLMRKRIFDGAMKPATIVDYDQNQWKEKKHCTDTRREYLKQILMEKIRNKKSSHPECDTQDKNGLFVYNRFL